MIRLMLAILLIFSSITVVVHGVIVYQLADQETRMTEDTSEEKPSIKEGKEISDDKISSWIAGLPITINRELNKPVLIKALVPSKGFYNKPYNPPEAA